MALEFLDGLLSVLRDLAILAAAVGVARWTWVDFKSAPARRDAEARAAIDTERQGADVRQLATRMQALAADITIRLDGVLARGAAAEERAALKVEIHALLQSTRDPFLTFDEIRSSVKSQAVADDLVLRRALIGLIADNAIAQLDRDRYFIATEFEADEN